MLAAFCASPAVAQVINEDFKLLPDDSTAYDNFGTSVAVSGNMAVVGACGNDGNGTHSGSAYLFDTTTGLQVTKLLPNDGATGDHFGWSVAISGTTAVVGAYLDDDNGTNSGSAYLFDTTTGQQIAKLLPNDGAAGDYFGHCVAISGNTAIVGAYRNDDNGEDSGSAYLFDVTTGLQIAKLLPNDGVDGHYFGNAVAISGTIAVVGAFGDDYNGWLSGSAYLFDTNSGQQIAKLIPSDGARVDHFGTAVAISGNFAVIGARNDGDNGASSGSAYIFDTTTGLQIAKLLAKDGAVNDNFGISVSICGNSVVVGADRSDINGDNSGSAYLFDLTTGLQTGQFLPSDGFWDKKFGNSVAVSGNTVVVGSDNDYDNGNSSGSAYVFSVPSPCSADLTDDGTLDFFDVSAFLTAYNAQDPTADFNADGSFNFFDVSAFVEAFLNGCP